MAQESDLSSVRSKEIDYIVERRAGFGQRPTRLEVADSAVGLALSGGGIRSATTNLGILQALSRMGILPRVDYLSTVSGGGYIGSCLAALLSVRAPKAAAPPGGGPFSFADRAHLWFSTRWPTFPFNPDRIHWPNKGPNKLLGRRIVSHLRTHGSFLIARRGLFRRDALRSVGHLVTGTAYHVTMLLLVLFTTTVLALVAADHLTGSRSHHLGAITVPPEAAESYSELRAGGAAVFTVQPMQRAQPWDRLKAGFKRLATAVPNEAARPVLVGSGAAGAVTTFAMLLFLGWAVRWSQWPAKAPHGLSLEDAQDSAALKVAAVAIFVAVGASSYVAARFAGTAATDVAFLLVPFVVLLGAKVMAFLLYVLLSWDLFGVWDRRFRSVWGAYHSIITYGAIGALLFAALPVAAFAAAEGATPWVMVAPVVSLVLARVLAGGALGEGSRFRLPVGLVHFLLGLFAVIVIAFLAVSFGGAIVNASDYLAWPSVVGGVTLAFLIFANINKVSPHYFYRDRLMETYLRTEYSEADAGVAGLTDCMEMRLRDLHGHAATSPGNTSPYLLITAAINLAGSRDLTRKDRKSGYFLFSKFFCGSRQTGYQSTDTYRGGSTRLGRAVTISGAAAGTGMGQNTFFAQSFFMALFNLRLGYWMANPNRRKVWDGVGPWPLYLLREMFGLTNERTRLVNLSDGGHTGDNVGIYHLLERRCQVIIACDAEADPELSFGSLTEALRHAYIDHNIDVDIDLDMIRPDPQTGYSRSHCAIGRIRYKEFPNRANWLIYLKNSLTGDEPAPVLNYRQRCSDFPHETTADQFFDDAQFESYRALGAHIAEDALAAWASSPDVARVLRHDAPVGADNAGWQNALQDLLLQHLPFHPADTEDFKELTRQFADLERMFLDSAKLRQYYAECMQIACEGGTEPSDPCDTVHAAAIQLQLMEDVFFSLRLYQYANAPDNRGWMNLFRRWSRSERFRQHVRQLQGNYSSRFVRFYEDYIEGWGTIDDYPIPHAWDIGDPLPDSERPLLDDLIEEERARFERVGPARAEGTYSGVKPQSLEMVQQSGARTGRRVAGLWLDRGRREAGDPSGEPIGDDAQTPSTAERSHGERPAAPPAEPPAGLP